MLCINIIVTLINITSILKAVAIHQSLLLNPSEELNITNFIDDLINKMDQIEIDEDGYVLRIS